jgi:hypothetical protein
MVLGSSLLLVAAVVAATGKRRHRAATLEKIFWARLLLPLARAASFEAGDKLRRLARTPLDHPKKGLTMFSYHHLVRRLAEVKELDLARLRRERDLIARDLPGVPELPELDRPAPVPAPLQQTSSGSKAVGGSLAKGPAAARAQEAPAGGKVVAAAGA